MTGAQTVVAIVENDAALLKALERLLRASGYGSRLYASAEQYLDRNQVDAVACLILDIDLGGISGIELQQRLVAQGVAPPIIFITSQIDAASQERAQALGCLAYLRKPFTSSDLLGALQTVDRLYQRPPGP
ncbi:response regulator transcription factor [Rugamonas apoptosis]|uniref:Response regulator n=1 Tax=Rugamonas apoptosis TaxID=2758570 RepID=A0A7W2ILB4_9BURK|nr:response regulator [Rugamonas apoptosis]MBA5688635.1 response regulator [Rugamonas apoptosis]